MDTPSAMPTHARTALTHAAPLPRRWGPTQRAAVPSCYVGHHCIGHHYIGHHYIGQHYIGHHYVGACHTPLESPRRGGRFEYRHTHARAIDHAVGDGRRGVNPCGAVAQTTGPHATSSGTVVLWSSGLRAGTRIDECVDKRKTCAENCILVMTH